MEYLTKSSNKTSDPRKDNKDKAKLFPNGVNFNTAESFRITWQFIPDVNVRNNIAYQMQYLEFQISLYNHHQIYLTHESLYLKNIGATISGIIEAALYVLVREGLNETNATLGRVPMIELIIRAEELDLIDRRIAGLLQDLRIQSDSVHFGTLDYKEYSHYQPSDVNKTITTMVSLIKHLRKHFDCTMHDTPLPPNTVRDGAHDPLRNLYFDV